MSVLVFHALIQQEELLGLVSLWISLVVKRTRIRVIGVHFRDFFYQGRRKGVLVRVSEEFEFSELELTE